MVWVGVHSRPFMGTLAGFGRCHFAGSGTLSEVARTRDSCRASARVAVQIAPQQDVCHSQPHSHVQDCKISLSRCMQMISQRNYKNDLYFAGEAGLHRTCDRHDITYLLRLYSTTDRQVVSLCYQYQLLFLALVPPHKISLLTWQSNSRNWPRSAMEQVRPPVHSEFEPGK